MGCDLSRPIEFQELVCSARPVMKLQVALRFRSQSFTDAEPQPKRLCRIAATAYDEYEKSLLKWKTTSYVPEKP